MDLSKYEINEDPNREGLYWYFSEGPKGFIKKVVVLQKMQEGNLYNLALGDEVDGNVSYTNVADNKDTKKLMVTITSVILHYSSKYPNRWLYIMGDTQIKTRLYQMHISNNLQEILAAGFIVLGINEDEEAELFRKGESYAGFLAKRLL